MSISKRSSVKEDVIKAFESGRLIPSNHAQDRMKKRDVQMCDIEEMIYTATREEKRDRMTKDKMNWKYSLRGFNKNGDKDIRIVVVFSDEDAIIVTVIDKFKKDN